MMEKYSFLVYSAYDTSYYGDLYLIATKNGTIAFEGKLAVDFLKLSKISPVSAGPHDNKCYSKCSGRYGTCLA
jgi:hypothetical protein